MSPEPGASRPVTEWIRVTSSEASSSSSGRIPGRRRASIVFPVPGGPARSRLWPPAAAISRARRARSCARTSARSGTTASVSKSSSANGTSGSRSPRRYATASPRCRTPTGATPGSHLGRRLGRADEIGEPCSSCSLRGDQRPGGPAGAARRARVHRRPRGRRARRAAPDRRREDGERDRQVEAGALLAEEQPARD